MKDITARQQNLKTIGIIGFVFAIISFMLSTIPCIGYLAWPMAILSIAFCTVAAVKYKKTKNLIILFIIGTFIGAVSLCISGAQYFIFKQIHDLKNRIDEKSQKEDYPSIESELIEFFLDAYEKDIKKQKQQRLDSLKKSKP